jgi:hypothetical protein
LAKTGKSSEKIAMLAAMKSVFSRMNERNGLSRKTAA